MQFFVRLDHIRKCFTQKGGIFVLEEFSKWTTRKIAFFFLSIMSFTNCTDDDFFYSYADPKTRHIIQRKYKSSMVSDYCFFVVYYHGFISLCLFVYNMF